MSRIVLFLNLSDYAKHCYQPTAFCDMTLYNLQPISNVQQETALSILRIWLDTSSETKTWSCLCSISGQSIQVTN